MIFCWLFWGFGIAESHVLPESGVRFWGCSGGYVRGPENLYLRGPFRVLLISRVFPYLCRYENRELEHLYTKLQGSVW